MSNPNGIDPGEWLAITATSMLASVGAAMAWFNASKRRLHDRVTVVEDSMNEWDELHADHTTQLAVIKTCQENTRDRLESIDVTTSDTNRKIEDLHTMLTKFMIALKLPS